MARLVLLLLPLAALANAKVAKCGGSATVDLNGISVTGCDNPEQSQPCIFKKGRNASISLPFTPEAQVGRLTAKVAGIIAGVPVPFSLPHPNACTNAGLTCPLNAGETYTYHASLPVRRIYPSIPVKVRWQLIGDDGKEVVCILIPVILQ